MVLLSGMVVPAGASAAQAGVMGQDAIVHVPQGAIGYSTAVGKGVHRTGPYAGNMNVVVGLNVSGQRKLDSFLNSLYDPASPSYHQYLSRSQFTERFSPSLYSYDRAIAYFDSFGGLEVTGYSDRLAISLTGSAAAIGNAFHTSIAEYAGAAVPYYQAVEPSLPLWLSGQVSYISGLQNLTRPGVVVGGAGASSITGSVISYSGGYPVPLGNGNPGPQYMWASDLQKAYNVEGIIANSSSNGSVIATVFWTNGTAPYYPQDLGAYFNTTLPSWESKPTIIANPIDNAMLPGPSARNGTSGDVLENTLDLEMAGSLAPGSTIFDVYGPSNSFSELDMAFAHILNPGNNTSRLNNVSVISNSWYSGDRLDPILNMYLKEAAARGITVVACSGDSGDNPSSPKYIGSNAAYPGTFAAASYGVLSVGGTTVTLNVENSQAPFLSISSEKAWFSPTGTEGNAGPIGSQGGISAAYPEPSWQLNSTANATLQGMGRGVPDVSAVANYMLIFITEGDISYYDTPYYFFAWGTSVAAPVVAGIIADMNSCILAGGGHRLGFINPVLYNLSNIQYGYRGVSQSHFGNFLDPFHDITNGSNSRYSAGPGYDLVTGLGSINAANLTHDVLNNITYEYYPGGVTSPGSTPFSPEHILLITAVVLMAAVLASIAIVRRRRGRP